MASKASKWADTAEDKEAAAQRKREKEEKKRAKAEREAARLAASQTSPQSTATPDHDFNDRGRPRKRARLSPQRETQRETIDLDSTSDQKDGGRRRIPPVSWTPCRHVDVFEKLNHIEEGSYGFVSRARETSTGKIVALKKLKMDNAQDGFPVTGLREIQTLMAARHENIVGLQEVVMGDTMDDVFLVMPFLEHDLRTLLDAMPEPFLPSETKTLLHQLTSAIAFLHSHWILHRDLKTSNLLLSNRGVLKLADFGMARYSGDPPPKLTQLVVTLWYRSPELLLGTETYGKEVDVWSIGCVFGELLVKEPLLQGKNEVDQVGKIFEHIGLPDEKTWPGFRRLPNAKALRLPRNASSSSAALRSRIPYLTGAGFSLLSSMLSLNPAKRPAAEEILKHQYFKEDPKPKPSSMFPSFPSKAQGEKRRKLRTPDAPRRGEKVEFGDADFSGLFSGREEAETGAGWSLKLG